MLLEKPHDRAIPERAHWSSRNCSRDGLVDVADGFDLVSTQGRLRVDNLGTS